MTMFKSALALCGLSQAQAAEFFGVRLDTVKSWTSGRKNPPIDAWRMLADLYGKVVNVSEDALDTLDTDDLTRESINSFALQYDGERLPEHAETVAAAMFLLARLADE